jgi:hypothetical protein
MKMLRNTFPNQSTLFARVARALLALSVKNVEKIGETSCELFANHFADNVVEIKFKDGRKVRFGSVNEETRMDFRHAEMNDNVCTAGYTDGKLMTEETGSKTKGIGTSNVTTEETTFPVPESNCILALIPQTTQQ